MYPPRRTNLHVTHSLIFIWEGFSKHTLMLLSSPAMPLIHTLRHSSYRKAQVCSLHRFISSPPHCLLFVVLNVRSLCSGEQRLAESGRPLWGGGDPQFRWRGQQLHLQQGAPGRGRQTGNQCKGVFSCDTAVHWLTIKSKSYQGWIKLKLKCLPVPDDR